MKAVTLNRDGQCDITSSHSRKMRLGVHLEDFQQDKNLSEITFKTKKNHTFSTSTSSVVQLSTWVKLFFFQFLRLLEQKWLPFHSSVVTYSR